MADVAIPMAVIHIKTEEKLNFVNDLELHCLSILMKLIF